jgi:dTMP kinase
LYEASRAQHVDQVIRPALQKNQWVLCDRFSASSVAFQAGGREISEAWVERLNEFSTGNLVPELTVLLDLSQSA